MSVSADQKPDTSSELAKFKYGAWVSAAAFALLGAVFGVAVSRFTTAADVTAVLAPVTTLIGTIVGAFTGVQAGAAGRAVSEASRNKAERTTQRALAELEPTQAKELLDKL
jgi:hypothetical protein